MNDISFRTESLAVRARFHGASGGTLFVTFVPWVATPSLERSGYGEDYLAQQRIDAVHVITARNDWFQHQDVGEMLTRIQTIASRYDRVVTYGTSMGAYAALNFARPLRADRAIALMPQFSISSREMPAETRWRTEASEISFRHHYMDLPLKEGARAFVVHDPYHDLDRAQALRIASTPGCELVPLPLIGHNWIDPVLLKQMVRMVVEREDRDLPGVIAQAYRERKKSLPSYYVEMVRARPKLNAERKMRIIMRALALAPERAVLHDELAQILSSNGRLHEALYVQRTQTTLRPEDAGLQYRLSETYEKLGLHDETFAASTKAVLLDPNHAYYRHRLASAHLRRGDLDAALTEQHEALRLTPSNGEYHRQLGIIHGRSGQLELARAAARTATSKGPTSAFNWHCLADVLLRSEHYEEARSAAETALALEPSNAYHHYFLARILLKLGEGHGVAPLLDEALRLQPGNDAFRALRATLP